MTLLTRTARALALAFALGLAAPAPSIAQNDFGALPGAEPESEGKPLFGYLAAGFGCVAIMFVVCLSARR